MTGFELEESKGHIKAETFVLTADLSCELLHQEFTMSIQQIIERQRKINLLKSVYVFAAISETKIEWLIEKLEPLHFKSEEVIIQEGEKGTTFYII